MLLTIVTSQSCVTPFIIVSGARKTTGLGGILGRWGKNIKKIKWVSCRNPTVRTCFALWYYNLCLFIEIFKPFTFNCSINWYGLNLLSWKLFSICPMCSFHPLFHLLLDSPNIFMLLYHWLARYTGFVSFLASSLSLLCIFKYHSLLPSNIMSLHE